MADNNQVLVDAMISQERMERAPQMKADDYFELFTIQLIMRKYDLDDEEIQDGITDGASDGGCDGIFLFVNGDLIRDDINDYEKYKKFPEVSLHIIQSKNTVHFSEDTIMKWKTISENLFDLGADYSIFKTRYKEDVLSKLDIFRKLQLALIRKSPKLTISFHYATKATEIHPNIKAQCEELKEIVKKMFPSANVIVDIVTAAKLIELNRTWEDSTRTLVCKEIVNASMDQEYIALASLPSYYKFITDEEGNLIRNIFESNVRDYQGKVAVNKQIEETLENSNCQEDFWWLNNGVTILAKSVQQQSGKHLNIVEPEIVNGLQSSSEIYSFFNRDTRRLETDNRNVLVRVIVPKSEESRDHIILATNSQTTIPKSSLRATDLVHRNIEQYFKSKGLYYDRRKNYYKNLGKPIENIISIPFLGQCLMSTILAQPDYARARPSTLLEKDATYKKLFSDKTNLECFYIAAILGKFVISTIKQEEKYSASEKSNISFATLFYYTATLVHTTIISFKLLENINIANLKTTDVIDCADKVLGIYKSLGGTDKIAKNSEFTVAMVNSLEKEFTHNKAPLE